MKNKIIKAMKKKGLKQKFLADKIGVTDVYLCRLFKRKTELPKGVEKRLVNFLFSDTAK